MVYMLIRRFTSILAVLLAGTSLIVPAIEAQGTGAVTVNGVVVDAGSAMPLSGATLTLAPAVRGVFPPAGSSPALTGSRSTVSDSVGRYEMRGIVTGQYQLLVKRLGYQPTVVDVDVTDGSGAARLSVGLVVVPVRLQPVSIHSNALNLFGTATADDANMGVSPVEAARARQSRFLGTDVRELTAAGALEGSSLGETDIFKALLRMPGVTGIDERSTELWIRGGLWDQVRISYDGLPIFNPFHAYRSMTGISGDAIGAAFLHPGVRPVSLLGQGASLVDIRSRAPVDTTFRVTAEVSPTGIAGSFEKASRDGRNGISLLGRTGSGGFGALPLMRLPSFPTNGYGEIAVRLNHDFGGGKSIELSDLMSRDYPQEFRSYDWFTGSASDRPEADVLRSGTHLGRATFRADLHRFRLSQTIGFSAYEGRDYSVQYPIGAYDTTAKSLYSYLPGGNVPYFSRVSFTTLRGVIEPRVAATDRWSLGYELGTYRASSIAPRHAYSWSDLSTESRQISHTLALASVWGDRVWNVNESLTIDAGLRVETTDRDLLPRLAPSLLARKRLGKVTSGSIGVARSFQDTQELPFTPGAARNSGRGFWIVNGPDAPAVVADQASAGVEHWLNGSILLDANTYARRLSHVASRPLPAGDSIYRPLFMESEIDAYGIELGARKLTGRLTGSVGYSYGKATQRIGGESFTAAGDRTHSLDATAMIRFGRLRLGSAVTAMTGAPYTRMNVGYGVYAAPDTVHWSSLSSAEARNAQRMPNYLSYDAFGELTGKLFGARVTSFLGVRNLTDHHNVTAYLPISSGFVNNYGANTYAATNYTNGLYWVYTRSYNLGFRLVF